MNETEKMIVAWLRIKRPNAGKDWSSRLTIFKAIIFWPESILGGTLEAVAQAIERGEHRKREKE